MDAKETNFLHWLTHLSMEKVHAARARRKMVEKAIIFSSLTLGLVLGSSFHILDISLLWMCFVLFLLAFIWPLAITRTLAYINTKSEKELDRLHRKRLKDLGFDDLLKRYGLL